MHHVVNLSPDNEELGEKKKGVIHSKNSKKKILMEIRMTNLTQTNGIPQP